jgi:hypothetical protein
MQLFHHFCTVTLETLVFGPQMWREKVVPDAFQVMLVSPLFLIAFALSMDNPRRG